MILLFNKPYDVLCQFTDTAGRKTLADYVLQPGVYAAGRLDRDSEGLVVLTDLGWVQHRISHPRHALWKTYWVQVEGQPDATALERLRQGVTLNDGLTAPAEARLLPEPNVEPREPPVRYRAHIPTTWLELRIHEGRNRQVRRMTAAVGHPTLRLIRHAVGPWSLEGIAAGTWRPAQLPAQWSKMPSHDQRPPRNSSRHHPPQRPLSAGGRNGRDKRSR